MTTTKEMTHMERITPDEWQEAVSSWVHRQYAEGKPHPDLPDLELMLLLVEELAEDAADDPLAIPGRFHRRVRRLAGRAR